MQTWQRLCLEDYTITDSEGTSWTLTRGQEYLTSGEKDSTVVVFSRYWVTVPARLFAGARLFGPTR